MTDDRRTPRPRPGRSGASRGRKGPGERGRTASGRPQADRARVERTRARQGRIAAAAAVREEERRHSRLTGRAAVLVLVLAVLAVSYASSLRAYLQQRDHLDSLEAEITERQAAIAELKAEDERGDDPAYVQQRARELGYVMRGETPYVVLDENGQPLTDAELGDPDSVGPDDERTWYDDAWDSMKYAGNPDSTIPPPPLRKIDGSDE